LKDLLASQAGRLSRNPLAILSGSGDAAALAFNGAVTPHAVQLGFQITDMGSLATLSGAFGTMSPIRLSTILFLVIFTKKRTPAN
jgi:DcuC family C4-dicarboxylate transporter